MKIKMIGSDPAFMGLSALEEEKTMSFISVPPYDGLI